MSKQFWIKRFLIVLAGAFGLICMAQVLRGHDLGFAAVQGAIWGAAGAVIFTAARYVQARKGQHCALCKDTPEMREE